MGRIHKFLQLPKQDRRLLVTSGLLLGAIRLGLWLLPIYTLHRLLTRVVSKPIQPYGFDQPASEQVAWAVTAASRYVPGGQTCLTQALAAQVLLRRSGQPVPKVKRVLEVNPEHPLVTRLQDFHAAHPADERFKRYAELLHG